MEALDGLKKEYAEILREYLQSRDETALYKVSMLSRKFQEARIDPDRILEMHLEVFNEIVEGMPPKKAINAYNAGFEVLLELMMGYAVAYREYVEMHKNLYEMAREFSEKLQEANRLQELFISIISHDLKNPLTTVLGYSELIEARAEDEQIKEFARKIKKAAEKMNELISDARTYSKLRMGVPDEEFKEKSLKEVLSEVIEDLREKAEAKGVEIEKAYEGSEETYPVLAAEFLKNVFANVIDNAIKYGPAESKVIVEIKDEGDFWKVGVRDFGEGVPDDAKEAIFERFVRNDKKGIKGSGLGLAIAKTGIEMHGGRIWVEDAPGGGSIFYITIPKSQHSDKYRKSAKRSFLGGGRRVNLFSSCGLRRALLRFRRQRQPCSRGRPSEGS